MIKRPNERTTAAIERELMMYVRAEAAAQKLLKLEGNEGWEQLRADTIAQVDLVTEHLDNFEKMEDVAIRLALKERKDLRWFIDLVETAKHRLPELSEQRATLTRELEERRKNERATTRV